MSTFQVDIDCYGTEQVFLEEADDLISAYMNAQAKVEKLNEAMQARWPKEWSEELFPATIFGVVKTDVIHFNDEFVKEFVEHFVHHIVDGVD